MDERSGSPVARTLDRMFRFGLLPVLGLMILAGLMEPVKASADSRPRTRTRADRFVDRVVDGERISYLYGNVFIDRDSLTAASDTALYYRDREIYEFMGHVEMTRGMGVLTCERAWYERETGLSDFFRNVRLTEGDVIGTGRKGESRRDGRFFSLIDDAILVTPDYTVRADTIRRDRRDSTGEAFGHVRIMEPGASNLVTGDHAFFDQKQDLAVVDKNPVLTSRETEGDLLESTARVMSFYRAENRVVMVDSVRIRQGQTRAEADSAVAYGREHMILLGNPRVQMTADNNMIGDRIEFFYENGELVRVILVGQARMEDSTPDSLAAIYQGLPRMDVLEGDSISIHFQDEEIHRSIVVGAAHSLYTPTDLDEEVATNDVNGDTITIDFRNSRVSRVNVVGNMTGTYRFAKVAAMREMLSSSTRLADMLRRSAADSSAFADSLVAAGVDPLVAANADSLIIAHMDSLAGTMGMPDLLHPNGSAGAAAATIDSLMGAALDSLAVAGYDTSAAGLDFLANAEDVDYRGHSVDFEMEKKAIDIRGQGVLDYGTMMLTAEHINLDTIDRELYAEGDPLIEDSENIAGYQMGYDFRNRTGAVRRGVTTFDGYYYVGEEISRFPDSTLKICNAKMTSCDLAEPHYHFWADKMKMRMDDKVVGKPIALYIGRVPIFALPFYFKSLKTGRQSGILFPSFDFGWSSREGRYIRDFGYYWATNDYMDFIFEGDYNERQDLAYQVSNRYVKRYAFNGGVDFTKRMSLKDDHLREWQFRWNHNQPTLFDDYKFRADVRMASKSLSSNDLDGSGNRDIISGEMKSTVYLSRNFDFMSSSLDAQRKEYVNATDDDPSTNQQLNNMTLPSMSFGFRDFNLAPALRGGQKGSLLGDLARATSFKQNYSFRHTQSEYELRKDRNLNAQGNWGLTLRPDRIGIFNANLSSNAGQTWSRSTSTGQLYVADTDSTYHFDDIDEVEENTTTRLTFSAGVGTKLYGLIPMQVGKVRALRHTIGFNSSYSLSPGLANGRQAHSTSIGLSMSNRLDMKYMSGGRDSTATEKKLDGLLDWQLSTSYRPKAAPGDRWGRLSSNLTLKPGQSRFLRLKVSNSIDPKNLALLSTRFNYGLNFSGRADLGEVVVPPEATRNTNIERLGVDEQAALEDSLALEDPFLDQGYEENPEEFFDGEESSFYDMYNQQGREPAKDTDDPTEGGRFIPFSMNTSFSYSYDNPSHKARATAQLGLNATLTRTWKFNYTGSYDLVAGGATRQQFNLKKDLHCWALEFHRTVSAANSEFGFRIYLKSIPALKYTRGREDGMGALADGLGGGF